MNMMIMMIINNIDIYPHYDNTNNRSFHWLEYEPKQSN